MGSPAYPEVGISAASAVRTKRRGMRDMGGQNGESRNGKAERPASLARQNFHRWLNKKPPAHPERPSVRRHPQRHPCDETGRHTLQNRFGVTAFEEETN